MNANSTPEHIAAHHQRQRSVKWRAEPDVMITITLRLPPQLAAVLIAMLTTLVMRTRPNREPDGAWPTLAQQHTDALETVLTNGAGTIGTEIVLHVRGDGTTCDDGTPLPDTVINELELRCAPCHQQRHRAARASSSSELSGSSPPLG